MQIPFQGAVEIILFLSSKTNGDRKTYYCFHGLFTYGGKIVTPSEKMERYKSMFKLNIEGPKRAVINVVIQDLT